MGSPDPQHARQLNGMGGGISSLSKICVVGPPNPHQKANGIHVEYTFAQVGIRDSTIDYSGNCGNLSSMIGVFAVDEGICGPPAPGTHATIRSFNTNTEKVIDTTFPISSGDAPTPCLDNPEASVAGVPGIASKIILDFVNPSGARTGKLLPSGSPSDVLEIPSGTIRASCVDATNPTVFVNSSDLRDFLPLDDYIHNSPPTSSIVSQTLEDIRQRAAEKMGLDPSTQAQPKIAMLSVPDSIVEDEGVDIVVHALSMGVLHRAVPMTVGLCLGVAARVQGTLAWEIVQSSRSRRGGGADGGLVRIRHPSGMVDVGAEFAEDGTVRSAKVVRTGRRLMKGVVWW